jgi:hypothetical protein
MCVGCPTLLTRCSLSSLETVVAPCLQVDMTLGSCWPMAGTQGRLTVRLSAPIRVTAITIDHASPLLALALPSSAASGSGPASTGSLSAPRRFSVYSMKAAPEAGEQPPVA